MFLNKTWSFFSQKMEKNVELGKYGEQFGNFWKFSEISGKIRKFPPPFIFLLFRSFNFSGNFPALKTDSEITLVSISEHLHILFL